MKRKINSWSDYEKYRISEDIRGYFNDFSSKCLKSVKTPEELFLVVGIVAFIGLFTIRCLNGLQIKKDN